MSMLSLRTGHWPMVRLAFAAAALLVVTSACSTLRDSEPASAETYGYRWTGPGEPGNFASANSFCRQTLQADNFGALPTWQQRGSGMVSYNTPDTGIAGPAYRPGYAQRRDFDGCMRSQGWVQSAMPPAETTPAGRPAPVPAPTPAPMVAPPQ